MTGENKPLRTAAVKIRRFLLDSGTETETAYSCFRYAAADACLTALGLNFLPEQIVPELVLPEKTKNLYPAVQNLLYANLTEPCSVQDLGWLHQYYHAGEKEKIFAGKRHKQLSESQIPAATQFFTPEWLVHYMLENSLGRLFPLDWLCADFSDSVPQTVSPESVRLLDPCAGTGNILIRAFDMFLKIYLSRGESPETAVRKILKLNLFGLELDPRAGSIAEFSLMLKALEQDASFLESGIRPHVCVFSPEEPEGSLRKNSENSLTDSLLKQQYQIVVTNPPYMSSSGMPDRVLKFVRKQYPESRRDLYACFIERCSELTCPDGFCALLTVQNWMFLPSFAGLRKKILSSHRILHLLHLGACAFDTADVGTIVQSACWIMQKTPPGSQKGLYYDLCRYPDTDAKKEAFLHRQAECFAVNQQEFSRIPDCPLVYRATEEVLQLFRLPKLGDFAEPKQGITTSDNPRFVRLWHEVAYDQICFDASDPEQAKKSRKKWFPYHKGGGYRKWYGNHSHILNYGDGGRELLAFHRQLNKQHSGGRLKNKQYYFRSSITWSFIAKMPSFRKNPDGFLFDVAGSSLFADSEQEQNALLAFLCSKPAAYLLYLLNPTMNIQARDLYFLPYLKTDSEQIQALVRENTALCRADWDSCEISWNFQKHPLL